MLVTELRKGKQPEDYVLTRENGGSVRDLRGTWDALTKAAGMPGLLLHDSGAPPCVTWFDAALPNEWR